MSDQSIHDELLALVRSRGQTKFNRGILTADRYVKTIQDAIGVQSCYRHMCRTDGGGWASFDDVMKKAAGTLTFNDPDMIVLKKREEVRLPSKIERPKNTLMVFRHVLTTSKKDRDGDILRTKGAKVDPKMLLLFQHVHTMPIGKMLAVASHTKDELQLYSCIVDMNELSHDCAVMIDNDMGRFSHGFRALDFLEIKARDREGVGGFDVKSFEILEESLVSVPANPDSQTQEVILSLVEGGKLTSGLLKDYGASIRNQRPMSVPVNLDVKLLVNGQEVKGNENKSRDEERIGENGYASTPKEANDVFDEEQTGGEEAVEDKEVVLGEKYGLVSNLDDSWEDIASRLGDKVRTFLLGAGVPLGDRDWTLIIGTYSDRVVIAIDRQGTYEYWQINWRMEEGDPQLQGEPKQVDVVVSSEVIEKMKAIRGQTSYQVEGQKPYPNEHAIRLNDPDKYKRIRRQNDKFGPGIHAIFGVTEDGKTELQSIRFSVDKFTADEAREWLEEHDYKTSGFEPAKAKPKEQAKKEGKQLIDDDVSGGFEATPPKFDNDEEVKKMVCPECDYVGLGKGGKCPECGAKLIPRKDYTMEKLGRVLSKANEAKIQDAIEDLAEISKMDIPRSCKALVASARRKLTDVLASLGTEQRVEKTSVREAMAIVLAKGGRNEILVLRTLLDVLEACQKQDDVVKQYESLLT